MPANDDVLRSVLETASAASGGAIQFRALTARELGKDLGFDVPRSGNPIYRFDCAPLGEEPFTVIAYTLSLDGNKRPATRAEALGRALAVQDGRLFENNPSLLIFDYVEERLLAVSAARLFGAFAAEAAKRPLAHSDTASFSLSPSFTKRSVSMYATLSEPDVWTSTVDTAALDSGSLMRFLKAMRDQTVEARLDLPSVVEAVKARLSSSAPTVGVSEAGSGFQGQAVMLGLTSDPASSDDIRVSPRLWRMILNAIASSPAVILVGPPGTGKTALLRKAIAAFAESGETTPAPAPLWATPDESWTARDLVGGETIVGGEIAFRPGWVLRSIAERRWLVLDEANRADMDRIFGGLLTWLSGGAVSLGTESSAAGARTIRLGWKDGTSERCESDGDTASIDYLAGQDWRLLGTYNALDAQRVFRFGAALGRRFLRVPIPPLEPAGFSEVLAKRAADLPGPVQTALLGLYEAHFDGPATRLGPAIFLGMAQYLGSALAHTQAGSAESKSNDTGDSESAADGTAAYSIEEQEAVAEAYVVHAGTWIANLEDRDRAELRERVISSGALDGEQWSWVSEMTNSLA